MVSPSRVISAESCEIVLCEVGADGTKAVTVDRIRRRGAATRRRGVIVELRFTVLLHVVAGCDVAMRDVCAVTHEGWTKDRLERTAFLLALAACACLPAGRSKSQDDGTADATAAVCPCCSCRWAL